MSTRRPRPAASVAEGEHVVGRAVGRDDAHLVGHAEALEHVDRALHHGQVGRAAHDDGDQRRPGRVTRGRPPPGSVDAVGHRVSRGPARPTRPGRAPRSASSPQTVTWPSLRPGRAVLP